MIIMSYDYVLFYTRIKSYPLIATRYLFSG